MPWLLVEFIWRRKHHGDLWGGIMKCLSEVAFRANSKLEPVLIQFTSENMNHQESNDSISGDEEDSSIEDSSESDSVVDSDEDYSD